MGIPSMKSWMDENSVSKCEVVSAVSRDRNSSRHELYVYKNKKCIEFVIDTFFFI